MNDLMNKNKKDIKVADPIGIELGHCSHSLHRIEISASATWQCFHM